MAAVKALPGVLLAAAVLGGCASGGAPPDAPPAAPAAAHSSPPPAPLPALGGWTPPPDATALALRLGSASETERAAAEEALALLDDEGRCTVFRAGLRLPDGPAAVACAARLPWKWLDERESARCVALLTPVLFAPDSPVDFEEFRSYLGSDELGPILEMLISGSPEVDADQDPAGAVSELHRIVRAEHFPALCRLAVHPDEGLRDAAFGALHTALANTDAHREAFARVLLAHWQDRLVEGPEVPPEDGTGYPALLREVLRRCFVAREGDRTIEQWALRWMNDVSPGPGDAELLLAMEETGLLSPGAESSLLLALGGLRDGETGAILEARLAAAATGEEGRSLLAAALAASARRGSEEAARRLRALAGEDPTAFVLLAERDPAAAASLLRGMLVHPDPETAAWARDWVRWTLIRGEQLERPLPDALFEGIEEVALASSMDGAALARLGSLHPTLATRRLARAAVERLARAEPGSLDPREVGFLEVAAPEEFRAHLRERAAEPLEPENPAAGEALAWLLRWGDPPSGARLAAWVEARRAEGEEFEGSLGLLARSPCPEAEALLAGLAAGEGWPHEALSAYADLHGFEGGSLGFILFNHEESLPDPALREEFRRLVLAGRPMDALAAVLAARPDHEGWDLGAVDDPRVRAHLEGLRDRRSPGLHRYATEQLLLAGDAAAREELWSAYRAGRYRWIDEADREPLTLGDDLSTLPFWIGELESACCRFYKPAWFLDNWFGIQPFDFQGDRDTDSLVVPAAVLRRWWDRVGTRLRWSRIAEEFVVGPPVDGN